MLSIAFQGELGAYSEEAAHRLFGPHVSLVPKKNFREVGRAVASGEVDAGLLPIENTLAGSVVGSFDVLAAEELQAVGEVIIPIHHCVLGVPGSALAGVTHVLSHPVALAQCTRFLEESGIEAVTAYDTAGAAREVAARGDPAVAAIASAAAATRYGLDVLAAEVEDRPDNQTRFLAVVRPGAATVPMPGNGEGQERPMKTALLVDTANQPGALARLLSSFAALGLNLSKLESRPGEEPWTYRFFVEVEMDAASPAGREAIEAAKADAVGVRVLGSFPQAATR